MPDSVAITSGDCHPFVRALYAWHDTHARIMPWRQTRDPYHIWLSEIILQQTQVVQGTAYYERFIKAFPTVADLAAASEDTVMRLWQGLGYYSRARNLHTAAKQIVAQGGNFPTNYADIRALKGVGDYSASAIASFAFGLPYAAIDGNFYRVTARYFGIDAPIDTTVGKKTFATLGREILDRGNSARFNQAMMDFGATHCRPKAARCDECPLADSCVALAEGRIYDLPCKSRRTQVTTRHFTFVIPIYNKECRPHTLLEKRQAGDIWQSLYTPPLLESEAPISHQRLAKLLNLTPLQAKRLTQTAQSLHHQLTHRLIIADAFILFCDTEAEARQLFADAPETKTHLCDIPTQDLDKYAKPRLAERIFSTATLDATGQNI